MIAAPTLAAYLVGCAAIVVAPGPGQALVMSRLAADGRRAALAQLVLLGVLLAAVDVAWQSTLVFALDALGRRWSLPLAVRRWRTRLTGSVLVGLGVKLAA